MNKTELAVEILEILELEENLSARLDQFDIEDIINNAKILCKKDMVVADTILRGVRNE